MGNDGRQQIGMWPQTYELLLAFRRMLAEEQKRHLESVTLVEALHVAVRESETRHRKGEL